MLTPGWARWNGATSSGASDEINDGNPVRRREPAASACTDSERVDHRDLGEGAARCRRGLDARRSELYAPARRADESHAQRVLQVLKAARQRGLRDVQLIGRCGDRRMLGDGHERVQLSDGETGHQDVTLPGVGSAARSEDRSPTEFLGLR